MLITQLHSMLTSGTSQQICSHHQPEHKKDITHCKFKQQRTERKMKEALKCQNQVGNQASEGGDKSACITKNMTLHQGKMHGTQKLEMGRPLLNAKKVDCGMCFLIQRCLANFLSKKKAALEPLLLPKMQPSNTQVQSSNAKEVLSINTKVHQRAH